LAIVLKENKTYNPDISTQYGVDMTNNTYYGVVDRITYDKTEKMCYFTVDIYGTETSRNNNGLVVGRVKFHYTDTDFDSVVGNDGLNIPQAYTIALGELTDWESDEV
jgi:hypothetical protein